jgi:glycosyltransferase involved in cell wall biosynthesis
VKILILHQHFNTPEKGGPLRSYYLAKTLLHAGVQVSVITARKQAIYTNEVIEGIDVHYLPIAYDNRFGFYKRGMSFVKYAMESVRIAGKLKDVSLCYAISVPLTVGQAALWIKRAYNVPFVFEVGDLWPDAPIELGFIQNRLVQRALYWLENRIYQQAKSIVALSVPIADAIRKKASNKTIHVIPNIADVDFYTPTPKDPQLETAFGVSGKYVVSYIGAVGFANGLDYYLECARAAQKATLPVHFFLCGDGASFDGLKEASRNLQLQNITFLPFTNRQGVKQIMDLTDATFISYRSFPILETGSPNKYFDGLAAGKLVVINFKGWIKEEIIKEQCGLALDPRLPHDFVKQITPVLQDRVLENSFRVNARKLAERKYARQTLGSEFLRALGIS